MSDNEHEEGLEYEEGEEEFHDGDNAFNENGHEEGEEDNHDAEEGEEDQEAPAEEAEPEPVEEPLPEKKEWHGFVRIHLPTSTDENAPLKDARVYFADRDVPVWTRYLVNDDVPYFDAALRGVDVSDPIPEGEEGANEEGEDVDEGNAPEEDEEPDQDDDDEDDDPKSRASSKAKSRASSKAKSRGQSRQDAELEEGGEPLPVEFDEDGCLVIEAPFKGSVRFLLTQLLVTQEADADLGLPSILVDEEELVFVATVLAKEDTEAEDALWAEEAGLVEGEEVPSAGPVKVPNLKARIMKIPVVAELNEEEGGEDGADDGEGGHANEEDDRNDEAETASGRKSKADGDDVEAGGLEPLEFRMDALTLSAIFCVEGFRRALLRKEMPSSHFLEGWLQVYSLPAEGTTDQATQELSAMLNNICDATTEAILKKKNPDPIPTPKVDEEGNEVPPVVDAKHPPPPPTFVTMNENGTIAVPKLRMDLRWTFELEKERPALTAALRYVRNRLLGTARISPSHPSPVALATPSLVQSYLEFLMVIPRSSLVAWTRPKFDEDEDDVNDIDTILISSEDDQQRLTPLSHMLGNILLDLRTREARKKAKKRDLRLTAFAAHKALLSKRFLERATLFDPLLVPAYAPKVANLNATAETSFPASAAEASMKSNCSSPSGRTPTDTDGHSAPWPASLRLYDSDLVTLACAKYGALETFQEVLTRKNKLPRAVDDTVGTYHLLFHSFEHLDRNCAVFLVDYSATEVSSIPLLTRRSIVPARDCMDDLFAPIDKDEHYPSVFAQRYWRVLTKDKAWKDLARSKCPSLYMRVQDEEIKMNALVEEITSNKADGEYVLGQVQSGLMQARDVISPATMYHAVASRNVSVIVYLAGKGVTCAQKPKHNEQALIDALLDDDQRRREERAASPIAARSADDLLASEDSVSDGILSILIALVEAGVSLQGVLLSGRRSVSAELSDRFGKCRKYKELMKLWAVREKERSTDPTQQFGILRYLPSNSPSSPRAR